MKKEHWFNPLTVAVGIPVILFVVALIHYLITH